MGSRWLSARLPDDLGAGEGTFSQLLAQRAKHVMNARRDLHLVRHRAVFREVFFEVIGLPPLPVVGHPRLTIAVPFMRHQKRVLGAEVWPQHARVIVVHTKQPRTERARHLRKYAAGNLGSDRSFYFRGAEKKLNLRAPNLVQFGELGGDNMRRAILSFEGKGVDVVFVAESGPGAKLHGEAVD